MNLFFNKISISIFYNWWNDKTNEWMYKYKTNKTFFKYHSFIYSYFWEFVVCISNEILFKHVMTIFIQNTSSHFLFYRIFFSLWKRKSEKTKLNLWKNSILYAKHSCEYRNIVFKKIWIHKMEIKWFSIRKLPQIQSLWLYKKWKIDF